MIFTSVTSKIHIQSGVGYGGESSSIAPSIPATFSKRCRGKLAKSPGASAFLSSVVSTSLWSAWSAWSASLRSDQCGRDSLPQFQSLSSCGSHLCRVDLSQSCSCHMLDMTCLQSISIMSERQVHFKPICKEKGHLSWPRALVSWIIMDHHGPCEEFLMLSPGRDHHANSRPPAARHGRRSQAVL